METISLNARENYVEDKKKLFEVNVRDYTSKYDFSVYYPASLERPRNHAVMFINKENEDKILKLFSLKCCILFCTPSASLFVDRGGIR